MSSEAESGGQRTVQDAPWLRRTSALVFAVLLMVSALFGSHVALVFAGHWVALAASVLALVAYSRLRGRRMGFGPLWLEMVDMGVLLGNTGIFLVSCVILAWRWPV
jgi:hypothetical protein